jgi:hypothetical protein
MTAVREGNKLEKEGFARKKPRQSKTTERGGKKQGKKYFFDLSRRKTTLKKTRR